MSKKEKKPFFKRKWVWSLVAIIIVFAAIPTEGKDQGNKTSQDGPQTEGVQPPAEEPFIDEQDEGDYTLSFGTLLDANPNGGVDGNTLVIKAKITSSFSNKATVDQNYHNVEDIILNQNGTDFDCIDYWAVADMSSGKESKVVAFTVDSDTIKAIADRKIAAIEMGDYVDDLYIHPSLKEK